MRLSMPRYYLSILACATLVLSSTAESETVLNENAQPLVAEFDQNNLELREIVAGVHATPALVQAPAVTTYWINSQINPTSASYVPVVFTQTFASVHDQLPAPGVGQIGLGTLQQEKRDAAPTPAAGPGTGGKNGIRAFRGLER